MIVGAAVVKSIFNGHFLDRERGGPLINNLKGRAWQFSKTNSYKGKLPNKEIPASKLNQSMI
ncbi:hypothetical protein P5673_010298 [Acropora cervicornis]|uniref:Uncharacterized protein n=1 Tax=Acropora cervicornis TaxID=6130 RepID=A0AAD9V978_ACRCE|nr:hypothetical protein P5673_010298 [Acropora cervicornis]